MKVLVAGAASTIGLPLTAALTRNKHEVLALTRTDVSARALARPGVTPIVADVLNRGATLAAVRGLSADAVVNVLTAMPPAPLKHRDMNATDALRLDGTATMVEVAQAVGASRWIGESMTFAYGYGDWGDRVLTERDPIAPPGATPELEAHMAGLRAVEDAVAAFNAAGAVRATALRFGLFYGTARSMDYTMRSLRWWRLPLTRGGRAVHSYIHVDDAVQAILATLRARSAGPAFNIVDEEPVTLKAFYGLIAKKRRLPKPTPMPAPLVRAFAPLAAEILASSLRVSGALAQAELSWKPEFPTYVEGVEDYIENNG